MVPPTSAPVDFASIARLLGLKTELAKAILPVALANLQTLDRKQQDYGSANLTDFGTFGVVVRLNDKISRIKNLMKKGGALGALYGMGDAKLANVPAQNESLGDSFLDASNYSLIAFVQSQGSWPKSAAQPPPFSKFEEDGPV